MTTKTQALNVELDSDLYEWLKSKAADDRRTLKATLELILQAASEREAVA